MPLRGAPNKRGDGEAEVGGERSALGLWEAEVALGPFHRGPARLVLLSAWCERNPARLVLLKTWTPGGASYRGDRKPARLL